MSTSQDELVRVGFWGSDGKVEHLWAAAVGPNLYRLDNAPAFAFGVSLNAVVEVHLDENGNRWVLRVVERGQVSTVRVLLDERCPRAVRLTKMLDRLGCSATRSSWGANIGIGLGLVAAGVGTYLLLTAPRAPARSLASGYVMRF